MGTICKAPCWTSRRTAKRDTIAVEPRHHRLFDALTALEHERVVLQVGPLEHGMDRLAGGRARPRAIQVSPTRSASVTAGRWRSSGAGPQ